MVAHSFARLFMDSECLGCDLSSGDQILIVEKGPTDLPTDGQIGRPTDRLMDRLTDRQTHLQKCLSRINKFVFTKYVMTCLISAR